MLADDMRGANGFQHEFQAAARIEDLHRPSSGRKGRCRAEKRRKKNQKRNVGFEPKHGLNDLQKTSAAHLHSTETKLL
jgi:hypothetical protein